MKKCHWVSHWLNHWLTRSTIELSWTSGTSPRQLTRWQKKQSSAKMRCWQDEILTFAKDGINIMFLVSQFEIAGEGSVQSVQRGLSNGNNRWVQIQRGVFTYLSIKHWGLILYSYDFQVYQSLFPLGESAKYAHLVFKTIDKDNTGSSSSNFKNGGVTIILIVTIITIINIVITQEGSLSETSWTSSLL